VPEAWVAPGALRAGPGSTKARLRAPSGTSVPTAHRNRTMAG
jgi:hypothetical protein